MWKFKRRNKTITSHAQRIRNDGYTITASHSVKPFNEYDRASNVQIEGEFVHIFCCFICTLANLRFSRWFLKFISVAYICANVCGCAFNGWYFIPTHQIKKSLKRYENTVRLHIFMVLLINGAHIHQHPPSLPYTTWIHYFCSPILTKRSHSFFAWSMCLCQNHPCKYTVCT